MPDIRETLKALDICMSDKTIVSLQVPHLARLVEENQLDTIYDEHYFYFSVVIALNNGLFDFYINISVKTPSRIVITAINLKGQVNII